MWYLGPLGTEDRRPHGLAEGRVSVGRASDCAVRLEDPRISRHHARLDVTREGVRVEDLGSHNGVFVNGRRVREAEVQPGDELRFGHLAFTLLREDQGPSPAPARAEAGAPAAPPSAAGPSQVLERGRLTPVPPPDTRRLQVLYDIVHTLVANLQLEDILPAVLETLRDLFAYDRCAVAGRGENHEFTTLASYPPEATPLSRTIAERVLEQGEALLCDDIQGQAPASLSESIVGLNIRSVLCAPLVFRGQVRGIIYLDRSVAGAYTLDDLALLHHVCDLVAIALENARLYADLQARFQDSAERLRAVQSRLVESEQVAALGRLTQALAHEVRNPIVVIGGMSRRLGRLVHDPELARDVETIVAEAQRLEALLRHVEEVVALPEVDFRMAPLEDTTEAALNSARPELDAAGISVEVHSQLHRRSIPHDPILTRAAVAAALRKAMTAGRPGRKFEVTLAETDEGWSVRVGQGPGGEGELRDFFDPYFRGHPWADDLALTLATTAMERQGGNLRLGTDPARGPDIELTLSASAPQEVVTSPQEPRLPGT